MTAFLNFVSLLGILIMGVAVAAGGVADAFKCDVVKFRLQALRIAGWGLALTGATVLIRILT